MAPHHDQIVRGRRRRVRGVVARGHRSGERASRLLSTVAEGQAPTPAAVPKPLSVTLLGTGTPSPSLDRQSFAFLIEIGRDVIVWNHGPGAHHRLLQSGHRSVDVTHAFFTHLHYDHCMDYGRLVLQRWDQGAGRIGELNVYGPPPIARMTDQLFGVDGIYGPEIRARIEPEQPGSVRGARRHAAAPASGAESNGDPRRFGDQRRWLETYGGSTSSIHQKKSRSSTSRWQVDSSY